MVPDGVLDVIISKKENWKKKKTEIGFFLLKTFVRRVLRN